MVKEPQRPREARSRAAFDEPVDEVVGRLLDHLLGLGPLETILRRPDVEDIAINGPADVWYYDQAAAAPRLSVMLRNGVVVNVQR